ncbi:MAG: alpha/beta fold hydrolase [Acidimicrobiales bacterium]
MTKDLFFTHDDLRFVYSDSGASDGEVVVLLHGFPQTRACWDGVTPHLVGAGLRVLALDQRGYSRGARPLGRRAYRLELLVADVVALVDHIGVDRVHVVGHDWGGAVAWSLAAREPDRLHTMTSLATPHSRAMIRSFWSSDQALRSLYIAAFQLPFLPELAITGRGERLLRRTLERSGLPSRDWERYRALLQKPGAFTAALNWYRALPFASSADRGRSSVATLYVYGALDFALRPRAASLTREEVDGPYRFETLADVGHWLPERAPDRVAALVLEHIAEHGAAEASRAASR